MPTYTYKAIDENGAPTNGKLVATDEVELLEALEKRGYFLLESSSKGESFTGRKVYGGGIRARELIDFTHNLILVLSSGIAIREGLLEMAEEFENPGFRKVLQDIGNRINAGATLADAMAVYPKIFNITYTSIVAAGEASGSVEEVLRKLVTFLEWREENKGLIVQASIYPAILFLAVVGLVVLLLTFLLPRIANIFEKSTVELPTPTKVLLQMSDFLIHHWPIMIGAIGAVVASWIIAGRTEGGRYFLDGFKLRIPFFGTLMRHVCAANFCQSLSTMTHAGISLPKALGIVSKVVNNKVIERAVLSTRVRVEEGLSLSEAIREVAVFQPLVVRLISVGEETGNLEEALGHISAYYDRVVPQAVKRFMAMIEPAIILFAGATVGFIILCTLLPIFRLIKAVKS